MKSTTDFLKIKSDGKKIVMVTAYDYPSAKQAELWKQRINVISKKSG